MNTELNDDELLELAALTTLRDGVPPIPPGMRPLDEIELNTRVLRRARELDPTWRPLSDEAKRLLARLNDPTPFLNGVFTTGTPAPPSTTVPRARDFAPPPVGNAEPYVLPEPRPDSFIAAMRFKR